MRAISIFCLLLGIAAMLIASGCIQSQTPAENMTVAQTAPTEIQNPVVGSNPITENRSDLANVSENMTHTINVSEPQKNETEKINEPDIKSGNETTAPHPQINLTLVNLTSYSDLHCVRPGPELNGTALKDLELIVLDSNHFEFISYGLNGNIGTRIWVDASRMYDVGLQGDGEVQTIGPERGRPIDLFLQMFSKSECKNVSISASEVAVPQDIVFKPK